MGYLSRISRSFENALILPLSSSTKYVIFSDCHRGVGNANDNFLKNEALFGAALQAYYQSGYAYIELGDGDELWENRSLADIQAMHEHVFCLMKKFEQCKRLHLIHGNHDQVKARQYFSPGCPYYSGAILKDCQSDFSIYLTHGHQADWFNSSGWRLARFLVRYVWKPLELLGVRDPTSSASNYRLKDKCELRLHRWALLQQAPLIAGHTHRAMANEEDHLYFNSGCCIYPGGITALELCGYQLTLVKWMLGTRDDRSLYVARETLSDTIDFREQCTL